VFQETYVVTFTDSLLIVWELKKIVANKSDGYQIVQLSEMILGFQQILDERELLINLEFSMAVLHID
jgi:hypothetical protein